jgi:tRNA A-37 threonylcarbamoyl transferase component Bud32
MSAADVHPDSATGPAAPGLPTDPPPPEAASRPPAVPGYEVLEELGRGGMGVVYKARHVHLNRTVALKMILAGEHAAPEDRRRFLAEAKAIAAIAHPGVVQVHDFGTHDGLPFFALEYCPGGSLARRLAGTPLPAREAAHLVEQVARAVQAAHDKGILHRDLKPGNVLLDERGQPRVSDFGLARRMEGGGALTQSGAALGTPSYMAPEQARGRKDIGPAVDGYSLGAILYECLAGRPPFRAATAHDTLLQVVADEPVALRSLNRAVPRELETICHKCLQKAPAQRYASAAELADDLRRFLEGRPILARPVGPLGRAAKWARRSPLLAGMTAATVLALVGGTAVSRYFAADAREQQNQAVKKEGEAHRALTAVEESMAVGLLRPLGHREEPLNVFELYALEELASLPRELDRVRLQFIGKALEAEGTAGQLDRRREEAVIATIGLRRDLRDRVLSLVGQRLRDPSTPRSVRLVCARLAAALRAEDPGIVREAGEALIEELVTGTTHPDSRNLLGTLVARLGPGEATALGKQVVGIKTKDLDTISRQASALAALAGRMPVEEADTLANTLVTRLVEQAVRVEDPQEASTLAKAIAVLAGKISRAEAAELARRVAALATATDGLHELSARVKVFAALAARLPRAEAEKLAAAPLKAVVDWATTTQDRYTLRMLAEAFAALAGPAPRAEAAMLAGRALELAARRPGDNDSVYELAETFALLAGTIPQQEVGKQLAALCRGVAGLAGIRLNDYWPQLTTAFAALADRVAAADAPLLGKELGELARKTESPRFVWEVVARSVALRAKKLGLAEGRRYAAALVKLYIEMAPSIPVSHPFLEEPTEAYLALLGHVAPADAGALAHQVVDMLAKAKSPETLHLLAKASVPLVSKAALAEAAVLGNRLLEQATRSGKIFSMTTIKDPGSGPDRFDTSASCLSDAFAALAGKVSPPEVAALSKRVVALASTTGAPHVLAPLVHAFAALAGKLPAEEAGKNAAALAKQLLRLVETTKDPSTRAMLFEALAALARRVGPREAPALGEQLVQRAAATESLYQVSVLAQAFEALADRVPRPEAGRQATALANRIADLAGRNRDGYALPVLARAFLRLAPWLSPEQAGNILRSVASRLALETGRPTEPAWRQATFESFCGVLSVQQVIDLLKHPGCVGAARMGLLKGLGRRFHRDFADVWDLADHLQRHAPEVDCTSPLVREAPAARAGKAATKDGDS